MKNYLIRFDDSVITSIIEVAPEVEILGANNQHVVASLTAAIVMFFNMGYDIIALIDEYNKPELPGQYQ